MDTFGIHAWGMTWPAFTGVLILLIIAWLFISRSIKYSRKNPSGEKTPVQILKERYSKGEITKEEYDEKKKELLQ